MRHAAALLRGLISANNRAYEVLVQGEDSRTKLIERFRKTQAGAILVGSMSFWEGIDIKGDALSLVVIDKLPFAPKDDPVLLARSRWIAEQGGNPFVEHHVPLATIALKQGTGRLIRSEHDRGILIIGDRRVLPSISSYGRRFLESLPPFSRTRAGTRFLAASGHVVLRIFRAGSKNPSVRVFLCLKIHKLSGWDFASAGH